MASLERFYIKENFYHYCDAFPFELLPMAFYILCVSWYGRDKTAIRYFGGLYRDFTRFQVLSPYVMYYKHL